MVTPRAAYQAVARARTAVAVWVVSSSGTSAEAIRVLSSITVCTNAWPSNGPRVLPGRRSGTVAARFLSPRDRPTKRQPPRRGCCPASSHRRGSATRDDHGRNDGPARRRPGPHSRAGSSDSGPGSFAPSTPQHRYGRQLEPPQTFAPPQLEHAAYYRRRGPGGLMTGPARPVIIASPAAYLSAPRFTVGHDTWNRAATSLIG